MAPPPLLSCLHPLYMETVAVLGNNASVSLVELRLFWAAGLHRWPSGKASSARVIDLGLNPIYE